MSGMLLRSPTGIMVCFDHNHPQGDQCPRGAACYMSHNCPVRLAGFDFQECTRTRKSAHATTIKSKIGNSCMRKQGV